MPDNSNLEKIIGYEFNDKELLNNALTHSSYASEHGMKYELNNERLEFIGDAYLDAAIGEALYNIMPTAREGVLSKNRADVVCEDSLADVAKTINLGEYLLLGHGECNNGGREKNSILSDAFEALLGAIIIDGGYLKGKPIIERLFKEKIQLAVEGKLNKDYKSKLQVILQDKYKNISINYVLTSESGPDHDKTFNVDLVINGKVCGSGTGKSKSKAEQAAAQTVLSKGEI